MTEATEQDLPGSATPAEPGDLPAFETAPVYTIDEALALHRSCVLALRAADQALDAAREEAKRQHRAVQHARERVLFAERILHRVNVDRE